MSNYFNNNDILNILYNRRKHILIIASAAIVLSAIFSSSFFIKPKFKSYAVLYPSSLSEYSIESRTEQLLQLLQSEDIMYGVIKKFDLGTHYKIDSTDKYYITNLKAEFNDNVSIEKTLYESVEITVMDTDPEMAYQITNAIIDFYNKKVTALQKEKATEVFTIAKNHLQNKQNEIDSLTQSIQVLRTKYGIIEYNDQAREATRKYIRSIGKPQLSSHPELTIILRNLEEKGEEFVDLRTKLNGAREAYRVLKSEYDNALKEVMKEMTYASVITKPTIADKKIYPVRWLIVLASAISAVFLAILIFSYSDSNLFVNLKVNGVKREE